MYENRRNILVVGVSPEEFQRVTPFLARDSFEVDRFPGPAGALELTSQVAFEVLIVRYPLPSMDMYEFLNAIRADGGKCQRSSLIVLADADKKDEASAFIGKGANRAIALEEADGLIQQMISDLLSVAPRKEGRFMARLEIKFGDSRDMLLCQTENLSASGMLIRTDKRYEVGVQIHFEFGIPNDQRPIVGTAEIVRHTMINRDQIGGVGVRFLSFGGDSQRRFAAYIASL